MNLNLNPRQLHLLEILTQTNVDVPRVVTLESYDLFVERKDNFSVTRESQNAEICTVLQILQDALQETCSEPGCSGPVGCGCRIEFRQ